MQDYVRTSKCRRKILLTYFDPQAKSELYNMPNCCDNCRKIATGVVERTDTQSSNDAVARVGDFTKWAVICFKTLKELK